MKRQPLPKRVHARRTPAVLPDYTITDLCVRFRCSRQTVWAWRRKGLLPEPYFIGDRPLWTRESIDKHVESRRDRVVA